MQKRKSLIVRNIGFFEIFLLMSFAFAVSFILNDNLVSANHIAGHAEGGNIISGPRAPSEITNPSVPQGSVGKSYRTYQDRFSSYGNSQPLPETPHVTDTPTGSVGGAAAASSLVAIDKNGNPVDLTKIANKNSLNVVTPKGVSNFQYSIPEAQKGFLVEGQTAFSNEVVTRVVPQADGGAVVHFQDGGTKTLTEAGYKDLQGKLTSAGGSLQGPKEVDLFGLQITGGWAHLFEGVLFAGIAVGAIQLY